MDKEEFFDFSEQGNLTQKSIRVYTDFEMKDGNCSILGFHDYPNEMWKYESFEEFARHYESTLSNGPKILEYYSNSQ